MCFQVLNLSLQFQEVLGDVGRQEHPTNQGIRKPLPAVDSLVFLLNHCFLPSRHWLPAPSSASGISLLVQNTGAPALWSLSVGPSLTVENWEAKGNSFGDG